MSGRWARLRARLERPGTRRLLTIARLVFLAAMIGWLVWKVEQIGWRQVWASLPTTPWFYALFVLMWLALPLSETLIFGRLWPGVRLADLPAFIRKRVYNSALVGYSGEVYLFLWAERRLGLPAKQALIGVKDNALLSAAASAVATASLLGLFMATGQARIISDALSPGLGVVIATAVAAALIVPLAVRLRRTLISAPARTAGGVFGIHVARIGIVLLLQAAQWAVVLPSAPWTTWLIFLTAQMVISRLPILPNRDLLFLGAGLQLSQGLDTPAHAIAGLLLAGGALSQGANLLFFVLTSVKGRRGKALPSPE